MISLSLIFIFKRFIYIFTPSEVIIIGRNISNNEIDDIIQSFASIKIKNDFVIAHNGCENMYSYDEKFDDISYDDYVKLKVFGKFKSMTFLKKGMIFSKRHT
jgi:hypothetical protein